MFTLAHTYAHMIELIIIKLIIVSFNFKRGEEGRLLHTRKVPLKFPQLSFY